MKKTAMLLVATLITSMVATVYAQDKVNAYSFKPYSGITLSRISGSPYSCNFEARMGLTVGIEAEYAISPSWGITYGVAYSQMGAKDAFYKEDRIPYHAFRNGQLVEDGINVIASSRNGTIRCDYVNIPVMAKLYLNPWVAISAGAQIGILVDDKITGRAIYDDRISGNGFYVRRGYYTLISPYNSSFEFADEDGKAMNYKIEYFAKQFDAGIPVGISLEYRNVCLDARYYAGLFNILKGSKTGKGFNRSLSITLGYRFGSR